MQDVTYELKYCERCGSLGLRRSHSDETYCEPCGRILTNYSFPGDAARRSSNRQPKLPVAAQPKFDIEAQSTASCGRLQ
jgi:hypothetical protein